MIRLALLTLAFVAAVGCTPTKSPELRVIGFDHASRNARREVVFVQVTNPAQRSMRLTKLSYVFAAGNSTVSEGELELHRDVPAGAAIVVEVPMAHDTEGAMTLRGRLTAELDQAVQTFKVFAEIPSQTPN